MITQNQSYLRTTRSRTPTPLSAPRENNAKAIPQKREPVKYSAFVLPNKTKDPKGFERFEKAAKKVFSSLDVENFLREMLNGSPLTIQAAQEIDSGLMEIDDLRQNTYQLISEGMGEMLGMVKSRAAEAEKNSAALALMRLLAD